MFVWCNFSQFKAIYTNASRDFNPRSIELVWQELIKHLRTRTVDGKLEALLYVRWQFLFTTAEPQESQESQDDAAPVYQ